MPDAFSVEFLHHGKPVCLAAGGKFAVSREFGFRDTTTQDLESIVAEIHAGRPWPSIVEKRYALSKHWLYRIITAHNRSAFLETLGIATGGPALDIGAGWGQISRPLAHRRHVVALEPVPERLAFIEAAAHQEGVASNLAFIGADYLEVDFKLRFETICVIGVFEWAGAFQGGGDPREQQRTFLRKTFRDLAPGGTLVIGIENRLGLKYLLGCPDDHLGQPFVASLPAAAASRRWRELTGAELRSFTFSMPELESLLQEAGYTAWEFFAAFPDYKLPEEIIPLHDNGAALAQRLAQGPLPREHNGFDGSPLPASLQAMLDRQYPRLQAAGTLRFHVPSFFVRAR